jgi:hypothetical protein
MSKTLKGPTDRLQEAAAELAKALRVNAVNRAAGKKDDRAILAVVHAKAVYRTCVRYAYEQSLYEIERENHATTVPHKQKPQGHISVPGVFFSLLTV